jgi:hypothetical protein
MTVFRPFSMFQPISHKICPFLTAGASQKPKNDQNPAEKFQKTGKTLKNRSFSFPRRRRARRVAWS